MAANTESSSNMVSISTATSGAARAISRVAATPLSAGIWMSMTMTSRRRVTAARTACWPSLASPDANLDSTRRRAAPRRYRNEPDTGQAGELATVEYRPHQYLPQLGTGGA
jgi:hypothetical protein